jgi:hypothetical protein
MTTDQSRKAGMGRDFWAQYVRLNGWAMEPNERGLKVLARNLDVNVPWLRMCINLYLEA